MVKYKNLSGDSGVTAYALRAGAIVVEFRDGERYEYTDASTGAHAIAQMHRLAKAGRGLSTYIARHVGKQFARKWP